MADPISQILMAHIEADQRYLDFIRSGNPAIDGLAGAVPDNEAELMMRIDGMKGALSRHEARNA